MTEITSPSGQEQSVSLQKDCKLFCVILVENTIASPSGTGKHPDFPAKRNKDTTGNKATRSQEQNEPAMKASAFKTKAHSGCKCLLITETESSSLTQMSIRIPQGFPKRCQQKKGKPRLTVRKDKATETSVCKDSNERKLSVGNRSTRFPVFRVQQQFFLQRLKRSFR